MTHNKIAFNKASHIIVNTIEYMQNSRIAKDYIDKMTECAQPIKYLPQVERKKNEKFRIGFCGRIVEEKGVDVFIRAFESLKKERKDKIYVYYKKKIARIWY